METIKVELKEGLQLGGRPQTEAVVREATVGDLMAANGVSTNETIIGAEILRRQIEKIGEIEGLLEWEVFNKLTVADMERLQEAADEVDRRGRENGPAPQKGD